MQVADRAAADGCLDRSLVGTCNVFSPIILNGPFLVFLFCIVWLTACSCWSTWPQVAKNSLVTECQVGHKVKTDGSQLIFFAEILPVLVVLNRSFSPVCDATDLLVSMVKALENDGSLDWR